MSNSKCSRFEGKVAVVTGGTTGIGRAIVDRFIDEGGKVVVGARRESLFPAIVEAYGEDKVYCQACDVACYEQVEALVQAAYDKFGRFDVMFSNAGINNMKDFLEFTQEEFDMIVSTNFKGCWNADQAAGRAFVAHDTKGVIVNTASINARLACPNSAAYAATKGAIQSLTRCVAVELSKYGIRCNCFGPGSTDTPMNGDIARGRFPTYTAPKLMVPRMSRPDEQAAVACFLASDDASYVDGEILFSAAGWGLK